MEHLNRETISTEKKAWIPPQMEIISRDSIQIGTLITVPEGVITPISNLVGSATS